MNVLRGGRGDVAGFPIEVNHPLWLKGITVFRSSFDVSGTLHLRDRAGTDVPPPEPRDYFDQGGSRFVFTGFQRDGIARRTGGVLQETSVLHTGDWIGPFTITGIIAREITGLNRMAQKGDTST